MDSTAVMSSDLINLSVRDWEGTRQAELEDVSRDWTIADVLDEVSRVMGLPRDTSYQALLDGRELNRMQTLREAEVGADAEMEIVPDVHAG